MVINSISISDLSPFLTVPHHSWPFLSFSGHVTLNGEERLGTFEPERSNGLERTVENAHGMVTVRSRSPYKNERITVFYTDIVYFFMTIWYVNVFGRLGNSV